MAKIKEKKSVVVEPASSTLAVENSSTFNLCKLIKLLNGKKLSALKWLQKIGMLNRETTCDNCGRPMTLVHRQNCTGSRADKYEWECSKCRMCTKSLRNGTVFQSSKLTLQKITILMYFWAHDFPPHVAQRELSITLRTVNKWYLLCQEACMDALIRNTSKLGGEGRNLEIVEGKLGKRAIENYRTPAEHPVIGVIDVDTGSCFLQVVIGNTKATLLTLLKDRIANGSTLHSKCWRAHNCFGEEKFCKVVKNHKLTLINEDRNTFIKLHDKVCKSGPRAGTFVSFDPLLCATIYKNAMKNEEFFFVKFLGELGTLYRDGIRYEMMNQLERSDSVPGPSTQQRVTVSSSENVEWTSAVGTPCHRCQSKQYTNSEVQATVSDEIIVCDDADNVQNVSISKQNGCRSGQLSEGNSDATDDIIVLDDTCKSQNGITSEQSVLLSRDNHRDKSSASDEVTEVEQSDKPKNDSRSERTANTSDHISETDCAKANKGFVVDNITMLPNRSAGTSRHSPGVENCTANSVMTLSREGDQENGEGVFTVYGMVVGYGVNEPKKVENDKQAEEVTNGGHFDEIDISMDEQIDVHGKVNEKETTETGDIEGGVDTSERRDVREDVAIMDGGNSEAAAHEKRDEDPDITVCEQNDTHTDAVVTAEMRPGPVSKAEKNDSVEGNMSEEKVVPLKKIVPICADVVSDVTTGDVEDIANRRTVKDKTTNASPGRKRDEDPDLVDIDEAEENANECTVKGGKTNGTPGVTRDVATHVVEIDLEEDGANKSTAKGIKINLLRREKRDLGTDVISIDSAEYNAKESPVKGSKVSASPREKRDVGINVVNIDIAEDNAEESTLKGSEANARKREAASELVNIDNAEDGTGEHTIKRSKTRETATKEEDAASDLVNIDDSGDNANESTVKHSKTTVGKKRESDSDLVNIDIAEDDANECPVKRSKMTTNSESKSETGSALVNVDDNEDNATEQKDVSKGNATAKRESDAAADIVNIDLEDNSNEQKSVGKTNGNASRKSDVVSDVVDVDDVEDNAGEQKGRRESGNRTDQKEPATVSDVIDIDEGDSDVEVIETETSSVPDVMVVGEQRRKVYQKDESRRHERRLLIDNVPCNLSKPVLRTYFAQFGAVENIKILPIPSRRSLRYAVMEFKTREVVDTIQAARPHVLETGVKLVTFRGCSPDIDSSLNTRLKERMIVKVPKNDTKLTTEDVQGYFSEYGLIYHMERVTITGMESGSTTFVISFEDYDSADVACIHSPHTIKGVENVSCEKIEDDDLLLSGTEMDPICIENDSDVEEVVDDLKMEPTSTRQSQELKGPDEPSTSGTQSGGGKRLSDGTADSAPKRFRSYNTFERNIRTSQNTTVVDPTQIANGRFGFPAVPGGSGIGGRSGAFSWHSQGKPFHRPMQRPVQAATPAPPAAGWARAAADGAAPDERSGLRVTQVVSLLGAAVRQAEEIRKRQTEIRQYRPPPTPAPMLPRMQFEGRMARWQPARRPQPPHYQPRPAQSWTPAKPPPARPADTHRVLTGIPMATGGFAGPSHVTRTRPGPAPGGSANYRTYIPRASGSQEPRF